MEGGCAVGRARVDIGACPEQCMYGGAITLTHGVEKPVIGAAAGFQDGALDDCGHAHDDADSRPQGGAYRRGKLPAGSPVDQANLTQETGRTCRSSSRPDARLPVGFAEKRAGLVNLSKNRSIRL